MPDEPTPLTDEKRERRRQLKRLRQKLAREGLAW
jgi:hypothetical protein